MSVKDKILETKEKRTQQTCKTFELKITKNTLSKTTLKHLNKLFLEAKWFYNHILSSNEDIKTFNTKIKEVTILNKDKEQENRKIDVLSAQMKQEIKDKMFKSILSLSVLKKHGRKVGKLKFKSKTYSIPLKQYTKTFSINFNNSTIRIEKVKQRLKVKGLNQIPKTSEIANASLVRKANDFYLLVTTYFDKVEKIVPDVSVGIDFGCSTQLTLSNRVKINYEVPISKRVKKLDRKIMKKNRKRSNNKYKDQLKREKAYLHVTNKKKDIKNKIVNVLTNNFKTIIVQNESLNAWKAGNHGKKIQNTSIGGIMSALSLKTHTFIEVNKFFPSTQLCFKCGNKQKLSLDERTYVCPVCGFKEDRDINASKNIEREGLNKNGIPVSGEAANKYGIPLEQRELTLQEKLTSTTHIISALNNISGVKASCFVE